MLIKRIVRSCCVTGTKTSLTIKPGNKINTDPFTDLTVKKDDPTFIVAKLGKS